MHSESSVDVLLLSASRPPRRLGRRLAPALPCLHPPVSGLSRSTRLIFPSLSLALAAHLALFPSREPNAPPSRHRGPGVEPTHGRRTEPPGLRLMALSLFFIFFFFFDVDFNFTWDSSFVSSFPFGPRAAKGSNRSAGSEKKVLA